MKSNTGATVQWWAPVLALVAALPVIYSWIMMAGPNIDTILTYHRNHLAHSVSGLLQLLSLQDQSPLPQLIHYVFHSVGFSSVVELQASTSGTMVVVVLALLAWDLGTEEPYRRLNQRQRSVAYLIAAVAILLSPSFNASLTWVRYAVMIGLAWYAVWILEWKLVAAADAAAQRRQAVMLGLILGLCPLLSYTAGAVVVVSCVSLGVRLGRRLRTIVVPLILGLVPGGLAILAWLLYAGGPHLALMLLRTHATTGGLVKTVGKGVHLLLYPATGYVLFPGAVGLLTIVTCVCVLGGGALLYGKLRPELRGPLLCHLLVPIPLFVMTNVTSGYGMMGPGLILSSCAIKGILSTQRSRRVVLSVVGLSVLLGATLVNLFGRDTMSVAMTSNQSRAAVDVVISHLGDENAVTANTVVVVGDESSRVLVESLPAVRLRYFVETAPRNAPNIDTMLRMRYRQDELSASTNRVVAIITEDEQASFLERWMLAEGFRRSSFQREVGAYSRWARRFTGVSRSSQYLVEEWVR